MNFKLSPRPCPLCKTAYHPRHMSKIFQQKLETSRLNYQISECLECGLIHQNPAWPQKFYDNLYSDLIYDPSSHSYYPAQVERYKIVASFMEKLLSSTQPAGRILDFGCYDGSFVEWIKKNTVWAKDIEIVGYDIYLKGISEDKTYFNSMKKLLSAKKKFNVIVLNHVIEHTLNPLENLTFISNSLLNGNGYVILETPDISFINEFDFSPFHIQHTNYFTPLTVTRLLNAAGLATHLIQTFKNLDIERDPHSPSLLAIGQKHPDYLKNGKKLCAAVTLHGKQLKNRIKNLGTNISLGMVGCGDGLRSTLQLQEDIKIAGIFDNNRNLWGTEMRGCIVQPVEEVKNCNCDFILVCTLHKHNAEQITKQLSQYVSLDKVITLC